MLLEPYFLYDLDYAVVERSVVDARRIPEVLDAPKMNSQRLESGLERNLRASLLAEVRTAQSMLDLR